jgi:acetylornithine deacetylase/succinyl-diaminopimelate desuccinylase-like protein
MGNLQGIKKVETSVVGAGSIDQTHKFNEYISVEQINKYGEFLDNLINSYQ